MPSTSSTTRAYRTGKDVRALRKELGLSQADFGALLFEGYSREVAQKTISELECEVKGASGAVRRSLKRIEALRREGLPLH